jgi:hypothetical protein
MQSESIKELGAALSKAQGMIDHAKKDVENGFFKSKYADLASCIDAAKKALSTNGLAVTQVTDITDHGLILRTTLMHSSGEWMSGVYPIDPIKKDPQGYGSAITYARRYAFCAITGVAADDDDGNAATQKPTKEQELERAKKYDDFLITLDGCANSTELSAARSLINSFSGDTKVAAQKEFANKEQILKTAKAKQLRKQASDIRAAAQYADKAEYRDAEIAKAKDLEAQADKLEGKPPAANQQTMQPRRTSAFSEAA